MNKGQLIDAIAKGSGLSKASSERALNAALKAITGSLKKGDRVGLVGFGSWKVAKRSARKVRHPQTGKIINIPAKKVIKFKASSGTDDTGPRIK